jgi:hypothetical protein
MSNDENFCVYIDEEGTRMCFNCAVKAAMNSNKQIKAVTLSFDLAYSSTNMDSYQCSVCDLYIPY